jgi:hypothetical protein
MDLITENNERVREVYITGKMYQMCQSGLTFTVIFFAEISAKIVLDW